MKPPISVLILDDDSNACIQYKRALSEFQKQSSIPHKISFGFNLTKNEIRDRRKNAEVVVADICNRDYLPYVLEAVVASSLIIATTNEASDMELEKHGFRVFMKASGDRPFDTDRFLDIMTEVITRREIASRSWRRKVLIAC